MAGEAAALFALAALVSVGGGLFLYALVRGERENRVRTDRESAERMARRDTDDDRR